MDHGVAAFIKFRIRDGRKQRDGRRIVARRFFAFKHLKRDTHHAHNVAVMELNIVPACFSRPAVVPVIAAVDIEREHRVRIAIVDRADAGERRIIVHIDGDPGGIKRRTERGVSACQTKAGIGIQVSPIPPESLVQRREVVDIGERNCNVFTADELLARSFQRVNMCRIMRPLTAFIISIVAFERFQHGVIFCRAANNAVLHIGLEHIVGADVRCPRLCAVIAFTQFGRVILLNQGFGFCLAAQIVLIGSVVKVGIDQLIRIDCLCCCLDIIVSPGGIRLCRIAFLIIQFSKKRLTVNLSLCIGIPCQRSAVLLADRCALVKPEFVVVPTPIRMESFI